MKYNYFPTEIEFIQVDVFRDIKSFDELSFLLIFQLLPDNISLNNPVVKKWKMSQVEGHFSFVFIPSSVLHIFSFQISV